MAVPSRGAMLEVGAVSSRRTVSEGRATAAFRATRKLLALPVVAVAAGCGAATGNGAPAPPVSPSPAVAPEAGEPIHEAAWTLYDHEGRNAALEALVEAAASVDVLFVGERHGDPGGHRFQAELLQALLDHHGQRVILSLEMFERDVQPVVDEYLAGLITEDHFLGAARPWPSYRRDYRPMVEMAREREIPVVAANAPRRYVNRVSRLGPSALSDLPSSALEHLPPLPYPGPSDAYRAEWNALMAEMAGAHGGHPSARAMGDAALQAQALWDASMAHSIAGALAGASQGSLVLHVTGGFHVDNGTGTPEALEHYRPGTQRLIVMIRPVQDPETPPSADLRGGADFVVLTEAPAPTPRPQ
ncbi:MAG: hypothetical protein EA422_13945 [Gemmatimonadales bacterium]|nr:MAG: hypothetical protein EA422_13945 [Gemmatimonadales bacterium]